jgi:hypothetical protein
LGGGNATIQRAQIKMDCGAALLTKETHNSWLKAQQRVVECGKNKVNVDYGGSTRKNPLFRLAAARGASIGSLILEPGFLPALEELAPGDEVGVRLGTWLMDIQETDCCDGIALVDDKGDELPLPADELSKLKRNVISCLRKTVLSNDDGYVEVASHELHVVEDERDG